MENFRVTSAKPEITSIDDLLESVLAGESRVPRFQRPYVWSPEDMVQLFDSILKGYPIGSLLIWKTERSDISSLDNIGPISVPKNGPALRSYIVDGHQRVATLLGVLRLPENHPRSKVDDWCWWIAYDLQSKNFVHIKEETKIIPLNLFPLRNLLKTVDFARRTREIMTSKQYSEKEASDLIDCADLLHKSFRDYQIPLTVMRSGSLDDAVTIFARVNQRGRDMTPDQMVSALTFRDKNEGDFDLAESIDEVLGDLRISGFGNLERRIILQAILAIAGLDFTRPTYEKIVNRDSHSTMRPAVSRAKLAMTKSVEFLRLEIGLKSSRLLPYASLIVMLAIYFDELESIGHPFKEADNQLLQKWFWSASFSGWFAGATTTDIRQAANIFRSVARHEKSAEILLHNMFFKKTIRPFPESFDRRSARVRASLLVQIISGKPKEPRNGKNIDGFNIFNSESSHDIPYFFPNKRRPIVSNPANRVILPEGYPRNARVAFLNLDATKDAKILCSHFISPTALQYLQADDFENFIKTREQAILIAENHFLKKFNLNINMEIDQNKEEIDNDE